MGKHVVLKHRSDDESAHNKQAGCMWGFVHVLGYHNWHSNVRKMIHHRRYEDRTHDGDWSPETNVHENDTYEAEKLLGEEQSLHHSTKKSRATKKRSLRARIKAMIADEMSKENNNTKKPKLQRTYSIHHLDSIDDASRKIRTNWKHPIIFLPKDAENDSSQSFDTTQTNVDASRELEHKSSNEPDVYEIFKVDKELLLKHIQDSDKSIAGFSKFKKSRSFPAAELAHGLKLTPVKLENKQKEVWSFPRENKLPKKTFRSSSLNESLDKYARLFENRSGKHTKMNSSRSLKLTNDYGIAPLYFTRMHSLSYVDSLYSDLNLEGLVDSHLGGGSVDTEKRSSSDKINEDCESLREREAEVNDHSFVLDEYHAVEPQIYEGLEHESGVHELSSPNDSEASKLLENDEISIKIANSEKKSDLDYVRNLLEQSGITEDASEIAWYSSNQLLSPQLFEQVEARWPHARGELTGCPDFYGCWHHQMLFDLVNEVLVEVYDVSLPYYPKPLSSSCHVRPFPVGDHIIKEVCRSIGALVDVKDEEKESLDDIVDRDLDHDQRWMNLQLESEFVGLDIEEMIFDELVREVVFA